MACCSYFDDIYCVHCRFFRVCSRSRFDQAKRAHRARLALLLARDHGREPAAWAGLLVSALIATDGFAAVRRLNPFLTDADVATLEGFTAALMLVVNRAGQARDETLKKKHSPNSLRDHLGRSLERRRCFATRAASPGRLPSLRKKIF